MKINHSAGSMNPGRSAMSMHHGYPWNSRRIFSTPGKQEFVIPSNVSRIRALVWGGGGSGAAGIYCTGGGGGGFTEHIWACSPGEIVSMIIGAGGEALITDNLPGNAGGSSSLTSGGISLSATGGSGGSQGIKFHRPDNGGQGFGGMITAKGGSGGRSVNYVGGSLPSGGGSAGSWLGNGHDGGDNNCTSNTNYSTAGGGGIGGKGGDAGRSGYFYGSGGGVWGDGGTSRSSITGAKGGSGYAGGNGGVYSSHYQKSAENGTSAPWWDIYDICGAGGGAPPAASTGYINPGNGGPGAGGAGGYHSGGKGGILGGGGCGYNYGGGAGGLGGGGGASRDTDSNNPAGKGGNGLIILYF